MPRIIVPGNAGGAQIDPHPALLIILPVAEHASTVCRVDYQPASQIEKSRWGM